MWHGLVVYFQIWFLVLWTKPEKKILSDVLKEKGFYFLQFRSMKSGGWWVLPWKSFQHSAQMPQYCGSSELGTGIQKKLLGCLKKLWNGGSNTNQRRSDGYVLINFLVWPVSFKFSCHKIFIIGTTTNFSYKYIACWYSSGVFNCVFFFFLKCMYCFTGRTKNTCCITVRSKLV